MFHPHICGFACASAVSSDSVSAGIARMQASIKHPWFYWYALSSLPPAAGALDLERVKFFDAADVCAVVVYENVYSFG